MQGFSINRKITGFLVENRIILFLYSTFFVLTLILFINFNLTNRYLAILIAFPFLLVFSLDFKLIISIFILSLFYETSIYYFSLPLLLVPAVFFSFLINYRFSKAELSSPVWKYYAIFLLSIIPSYFISIHYIESWLISYNIIAFIIILGVTIVTIERIEQVKKIILVYLTGAALSSIYLIIEGIFIGKRVFGFSGVMFVDLVGIAIVISYSFFLLSKNRKMFWGILSLTLLVALIFTQTRNAWVSTGSVLILLSIQYMFNSKLLNSLRRKAIRKVVLITSVITISILALYFIDPNVFHRVSETKKQTTTEMAKSIYDVGSLTTRYFIWDTAINAFVQNPITGVGYLSFRFISFKYSRWDPFIYDLFVRDLPPHTTVLAILAETGIIGAVGFIIFMVSLLNFFKTNMKRSVTNDQKLYSFIAFWCLIYVSISMVMTDAWLWGTLHMLLAILIGISVALRRNINLLNPGGIDEN